MTKEQIDKLVSENIILNIENQNLIKNQRAFQEALIEKINALKQLGPWRRFWGYWKLVMDLIITIEEGIKNYLK